MTRPLLLALSLLFAATPALAQTTDPVWTIPDIDALPHDARGDLIRQGRALVTSTYARIGPNVANPAQRYAGNNLACTNCHLNAGTKKFGLPLWGLRDVYPQYNARAGAPISLSDRVNFCLTRSLNGRAMADDAPEMQAFVAYLDFLSKGLKPGEQLSGRGAGQMPDLDRPADPARGKPIYARACATCHGANGLGTPISRRALQLGYLVPPLWGKDSFNDGAGMARLSTAANFIHFNMPHGVGYDHPRLSEEQSWDLAAFLVSQPRPKKTGLDKDFPDLLAKPVDTPYGPYADGFPAQQHKYGPFGPVRAAIAKLKAEKTAPSAR